MMCLTTCLDQVSSQVSKWVKKLRGQTNLPITIVPGQRFSFKQQETRLSDIEKALSGRKIKCSGGAILPGDVILLTLPATSAYPATTQAEAEEALASGKPDPHAAALLGTAFDATGVRIAFTAEPIDVDLHARGGRRVYSDDPDGDGIIQICTAGFSVYRASDGLSGIATAAHCTGMVNFDAESPEASKPPPLLCVVFHKLVCTALFRFNPE